MNKSILIVGIIIFTGFIAWLAIGAEAEEVLVVGDSIPMLIYESKGKYELLESGMNKTTIIIYVSSACSHCKYQIYEINKNKNKLINTNLYLLGTENNIESLVENTSLEKNSNVFVGRVKRGYLRDSLGAAATPTIFVFNNNDRLVKKFVGETKFINLLGENSSPL